MNNQTAKASIVFFGSGPVAAKSLEFLAANFEVIAVITKPKPAHHKGNFPVITLSEHLSLPIFTVTNKQELSDLIATKPFSAEAAVLIDFGIIVAQDVIDYFPKGIINSHFSLLPQWRGADPITYSILSGQKKTGVSLMLLVEAMDEGPLLGLGIEELSGNETTPELTDRLINLSNALLKNMLPSYFSGEVFIETGELIRPRTQEEVCQKLDNLFVPTYSRKLTKADGELDFARPATVLEREIRAFADWPKSRTRLGSIEVTITKVKTVNLSGKPGSVTSNKKQLIIHCGSGSLQIEELRPSGKNTMNSTAFLAGYSSQI